MLGSLFLPSGESGGLPLRRNSSGCEFYVRGKCWIRLGYVLHTYVKD